MKFIFTCGGTAGHINPALAVASCLKENNPDNEFLFIGAEGMMEMNLVPLAGYRIVPLTITNISRDMSLTGIKHNIKTIENVEESVKKAKQIVSEFKPDAVIGTGGYVCFPVLYAASKMGIPTLIHESNAYPGLTTKMLSHYVDKILVGVEDCADKYSVPEKVAVTGTPVRHEFDDYTKSAARRELGFDDGDFVVLSVWGSLGSGFMNDTIAELIPQICEKPVEGLKLVHATGEKYHEKFTERISECDIKSAGIEIFSYIHDIPRYIAAADLVMCRAGASTLSELTYMGKPAILVPSPNVTNNHQEKNARVLETANGAKVILEGEMSAEFLIKELTELKNDTNLLAAMGENMKNLSFEDAAGKITDTILETIKQKNNGSQHKHSK